MLSHRSSLNSVRIVILVVTALILVGSAMGAGPKEKVIYNLGPGSAGTTSTYGLLADTAGNLYGVFGGTGGGGLAFELSPPSTAGGSWVWTLLHDFPGLTGAGTPTGGLVFDKQGNLYGTTAYPDTIFELSPPTAAGGTWTETILFTFDASGTKGATPAGKMAIDEDGNLYGTTIRDGLYGGGVVFELVAPRMAGGFWAERVLHNFGLGKDGTVPVTDLLLRGGVLYGTTSAGGAGKKSNCFNSACGTVFQLVRKPGAWTESILHSFTGSDGSDGAQPLGGVVADSAGNLYGTTFAGGPNDVGRVYELSPPALPGNPWQETTLYKFTDKSDGALLRAGLVRNKSGNLYGTARNGGVRQGGSVFGLKPPSLPGGAWTFVLMHDFVDSGNGIEPVTPLTFANGAIYGTTSSGGSNNTGVVFGIGDVP